MKPRSARCSLRLGAAAALAVSIAACDEAPTGEATLRVAIYGEEYVEDQVPSADVIDGWTIDFSTFLVSVTGVYADDQPLAGAYAFDLTQPSQGQGHVLGEVVVPEGVTAHLEYRIAPATGFDGGNATAQQQTTLLAGGHSIYVEGTANRGGESKAFAWGFSEDTAYTHCHIDRDLADGQSEAVEITVHADHLFYDDLESEEPNVAFDIMARADADGDGLVTTQELATVDITGEARYQVGSRPIEDLWGFVVAQTGTVGHIDGEGHCTAG